MVTCYNFPCNSFVHMFYTETSNILDMLKFSLKHKSCLLLVGTVRKQSNPCALTGDSITSDQTSSCYEQWFFATFQLTQQAHQLSKQHIVWLTWIKFLISAIYLSDCSSSHQVITSHTSKRSNDYRNLSFWIVCACYSTRFLTNWNNKLSGRSYFSKFITC